MKHLILYGYPGLMTQKLRDLLMFTQGWEDCTLVLMQDAVIGTATNPCENESAALIQNLSNQGWKILALQEDLVARGLSLDKLKNNIQSINYSGVIDLIAEAEQLVSWL